MVVDQGLVFNDNDKVCKKRHPAAASWVGRAD